MQTLIFFFLQLFHHDVPVVVARDTTYITAPLRPNGLPDYEKYLLELERKGVTPENNAAVLLFQALWPCDLDPPDYKVVCDELGLKKIPSAKDALDPYHSQANKKRIDDWRRKQHLNIEELDADDVVSPAIDHQWTSQQFPPLAEWVDANRKPLDMLVAASRRPRFYSPSPTLLNGRHDTLIAVLLPGIQGMREAARSLAVRAMRHVGENRLNEAWVDLLAIHRLARLTGRGQTIVEQLVGMACSDIACRGTVALLGSNRMTPDLARQIQTDLNALPEVTRIGDSINVGERLSALDGLLNIKENGAGAMTGVDKNEPDVTKHMSADWNVALRRTNAWFDRAVALTQISDWQERKRAYARFDADLTHEGERIRRPLSMLLVVFSVKARGEYIGVIITNLMIPALQTVHLAEVRTKSNFQLVRVAAALALYRAEHHTYPQKLAELEPKTITKLPVDYFDRKPLVYKRTNDGYLLYSTGDNGGDDGGSNETMQLLNGRTAEEVNNFETGRPNPNFPPGSDDVSIRVPRPPFMLPKVWSGTDVK